MFINMKLLESARKLFLIINFTQFVDEDANEYILKNML